MYEGQRRWKWSDYGLGSVDFEPISPLSKRLYTVDLEIMTPCSGRSTCSLRRFAKAYFFTFTTEYSMLFSAANVDCMSLAQ
jgi:hypothetical protein